MPLIIFVPLIAFFIWVVWQHRRNNLKAKWKIGVAFFIVSSLFSGGMIWWVSNSTTRMARRPNKYLIPQDYVGWVIVEYQVKGAPPIPVEAGYGLYRFSRTGRIQTSSSLEDGWAYDEFFYFSAKGRQSIEETGWGEGGMIWGGSTGDGSIDVGDDKENKTVHTPPTQTFFVGTEQQFEKAGPEPNSREMEKIINAP